MIYLQKKNPNIKIIERKLLRLMFVSMTIMIISFFAVIFSLFYKINHHSKITSKNFNYETLEKIKKNLFLPYNSRFLSQSISGNLISLRFLNKDGSTEIIIYNFQEETIVSYLRISCQKNDY